MLQNAFSKLLSDAFQTHPFTVQMTIDVFLNSFQRPQLYVAVHSRWC